MEAFPMPKEGKTAGAFACAAPDSYGEAASLVIGCAVERQISSDLLYLSVRVAETLAIGND